MNMTEAQTEQTQLFCSSICLRKVSEQLHFTKSIKGRQRRGLMFRRRERGLFHPYGFLQRHVALQMAWCWVQMSNAWAESQRQLDISSFGFYLIHNNIPSKPKLIAQ